MEVGICWPLGETDQLDPVFLRTLRATGVTHLRSDIHYRNPHADSIVEQARTAGFVLLPILTPDYKNIDEHALAEFAGAFVQRHGFQTVELLNEPRYMHNISGERYGEIINVVATAIRKSSSGTRIAVAGDFLQFNKRGPKISDYMKRIRRTASPTLYDLVAIHTYREPGHPDMTRYGSRQAEHEATIREAGKPVIVTEVGWNLKSVSEAVQADYLMRELLINEGLGVEATYIYAHIADPAWDFGMFRDAQTPRPAAFRISQFQKLTAADLPHLIRNTGAKGGLLDRLRVLAGKPPQTCDPAVQLPPTPHSWA